MKQDRSTGRNLPSSLQKMLTVTDANGSCQTTERSAPPIDLLARLDAFLPELAKANAALQSGTPPAPDTVVAVASSKPDEVGIKVRSSKRHGTNGDKSTISLKEATNSTPNTSVRSEETKSASVDAHVATDSSQAVIEMDLFVDNSLGQLVPSSNTGAEPASTALVRESKASRSDSESRKQTNAD